MSVPNYTNITEYLKFTCNVDNMIKQFKEDRKYVISLIDNNINKLITILWTHKSPIFIDNKCIFNMGQTQKHYTLEERIEGNTVINEGILNYYICSQCKNMERLIDFSKTNIGEPFLIEYGSSIGEQLVITETFINKLYAIKESPPKTVSIILTSPIYNDLNRCSSGCNDSGCSIKNYNTMDYLGMDSYTNNMLINWYLNEKLLSMNIPNIINMHIGFVCSGKGYSMYEYPTIGRIRHLQEYPEFLEQKNKQNQNFGIDDKVPIAREVAKGIISQLFACLHALRSFDFSHGGPSSRSILFKNVPCSYMYDGIHVDCPITAKICDLHHAGITVGNTRLYSKSIIADDEILKKSFKPIINTVTIKPFSFDKKNTNITIYRLKDPNKYFKEAILFMYIKHLGLPIYQSSFDLYGFMVSLMADRSFYGAVMAEESMYLLWRRMWLPEEFDMVQQKIQKLHNSSDPATRVDKILRFLSGFGLRCDIIDYGWDMIKQW